MLKLGMLGFFMLMMVYNNGIENIRCSYRLCTDDDTFFDTSLQLLVIVNKKTLKY